MPRKVESLTVRTLKPVAFAPPTSPVIVLPPVTVALEAVGVLMLRPNSRPMLLVLVIVLPWIVAELSLSANAPLPVELSTVAPVIAISEPSRASIRAL
nr:hypothetical protein GCM10020185_67540 [Pseudomonas brassicacearum subsp. brassicacearum]